MGGEERARLTEKHLVRRKRERLRKREEGGERKETTCVKGMGG